MQNLLAYYFWSIWQSLTIFFSNIHIDKCIWIIAESLYTFGKKLFFLLVFGGFLAVDVFFIVFSWFPKLGLLPTLFMVFMKPYFDNHEKIMKKLWKHHELPESHQKTSKKPWSAKRLQTFGYNIDKCIWILTPFLISPQAHLNGR